MGFWTPTVVKTSCNLFTKLFEVVSECGAKVAIERELKRDEARIGDTALCGHDFNVERDNRLKDYSVV